MVEITMAMGVLSVVFVAAVMHDRQTSRNLRTLEAQGRLEDLRIYFRAAIDCPATFPAAPPVVCDDETDITVRSASAVLIAGSPPYSELAGSSFKATCLVDDNGVRTVTIQLRDPNAPADSPESSWRPLFEVPYACGTAPVPPPVTPPSIPDYASCASLANLGRVHYPVQCAADNVVIAVNDGGAPLLTCCPVGASVLSANPAEQHVLRDKKCDLDEVLTGMASRSPSTPRVYCTKLSPALKVGKKRRAIEANCRDYPRSNPIRTLVEAYHVCDTCLCPEKTVMLGGHTWPDEQCSDSCASVQLR